MGRKRSAEHDWICMRCLCPCNAVPGKHVGGGQNLRACKGPSQPILRRDYDAMIATNVQGAMEMLRRRTRRYDSLD